jgi:hypothetical protein
MSYFDLKVLRIPKWQPALLVILRGKDRPELFLMAPGHGQAFDDHVAQGGPGDRL